MCEHIMPVWPELSVDTIAPSLPYFVLTMYLLLCSNLLGNYHYMLAVLTYLK